MSEDSLIAQILGFTGSALSLFFFISPVYLFMTAHKTRDLKEIPILMLLFNCLNTLFWIMYGLGKHSMPMSICNLIGISFNDFWLCWYILIHYEKKKLFAVLLIVINIMVVFIAVLAGLYFFFNFEEYNKSIYVEVSGYIASIMNVMMYGGPGQNIVSLLFEYLVSSH